MKKKIYLFLFIPLLFFLIENPFCFNNKNKNNFYNHNYNSTNGNSFVESGPIIWYPGEGDNVEFSLIIHENDSYDFYNYLINQEDIRIRNTQGNNEEEVSLNCINIPEEETLDLNPIYEYIFQFKSFFNYDNNIPYEINFIQFKTEILSIDSPDNTLLEIIHFEDDLKVTNNGFLKDVFNPYIIAKNGFKILNTSSNSVEFQIKAINDYEKTFDFTKSFNVTLKDSSENIISKEAMYKREGEEDNTYIYEITGLEENTNYEIISLNNTGLSSISPYYEQDNEIKIIDDLNANGDFNTFNVINPYIEENGFEILDITENSTKFQITVVEDSENSFDPSSPLEVTLNDSEGNPFNTMATYIEEESSGNNYVYEITELEEGTGYEIISLNNTGLAVSSGNNEIDNEILISDDLGSNGSFTTLYDNPYIEEGAESGFEIIDYTDTMFNYTITVYNEK